MNARIPTLFVKTRECSERWKRCALKKLVSPWTACVSGCRYTRRVCPSGVVIHACAA